MPPTPSLGAGGAAQQARGEPQAVPPLPEPAKVPVRDKEPAKIRDWRLECGHHASKASRAVIVRGTGIQVVPSVGETKDTVKLWWKDEPLGALPASLDVQVSSPPGQQGREAKRESGGGDTGTFALEAEYLGDRDIANFVRPAFWRAFKQRTAYRIAPGPAACLSLPPAPLASRLAIIAPCDDFRE